MPLTRRLSVTLTIALLLGATPASATRFYLQNAAPPVVPTPNTSDWNDATTTNVTALSLTRSGAHTTQSAAESVNSTAYQLLVSTLVTDQPVRGPTWIDGTLSFALKTSESGGTAGTANALTRLHVWVSTGSNMAWSAKRCVVLSPVNNGAVGAGNGEWGYDSPWTTQRAIGSAGTINVLTGAGSCSSTGGTQPQAGDYLVVELGVKTDSNATTRTMALGIGGTSATPLAAGDTDTTRASWIELSGTVDIGATYTATATATGTHTRTPMVTATPTATGTATRTNTPAATATATATSTHSPLPVVPPVVFVNSPTPADTSTPTGTATVTPTMTPLPIVAPVIFVNTPTGTPTFAPEPRRCPDMNDDGYCTVGVLTDTKLSMAWPTLQWKLPDVDTFCEASIDGITSAAMRRTEEDRAAAGPNQGLCVPFGGTLRRSALDGEAMIDRPVDVWLVDIGTVADFTRTRAAPRQGKCWGTDAPCGVYAPFGIFEPYPNGNARCVEGPDFGDDCSLILPCEDDPAPGDPLHSWCQEHVFTTTDPGVEVTGCNHPSMCQQRFPLAALKENVAGIVEAIRAGGAVAIIVMPYRMAYWQSPKANGCNEVGVPTQALPDGAPMPDLDYQADWEVAFCDIGALNAWARLFVDAYPGGPLPWIDLEKLAQIRTMGRAWRILGDQRIASAAGEGRCTCLHDSDCGEGGECFNAQYCLAGPRAACDNDYVCQGSNSQVRPGHAWCIQQGDAWIGEAIEACLEDWPTNREPSWVTQGILDCRSVPENPDFTPWANPTPTGTPTATGTRTDTRTPTATQTPGGATATQTGTPTDTGTPGPTPTITPTSAVPPLPSVTLAAPADSCVTSPKGKYLASPGKMGTQLSDAMRRTVTNYADCFAIYTQQLVTSPVCDLEMGFDEPNNEVPTTCLVLRVPDPIAYRTDDELRRVENHAWRDKLSCENYEYYVMWDWIRWRAYNLGLYVPPPVTIDYHVWPGNTPEDPDPWDVYTEMLEQFYVLPWINQIRSDLSASPIAVSAECAGLAMNKIGYGIATHWINGANPTKCEDYYPAVAGASFCAGIMPPESTWDQWCQGYREMLMPVYQGFRAAGGYPCGAGCP